MAFMVLLVGLGAARAADVPQRASVGAIRWDAWTGGPVTREVEKSLGPAAYHDRLPWFARVVDDRTVRIEGGTQDVMDQEIAYAAAAGVDYWAFVGYPRADAMSRALQLYLASAKRAQVKFCLVLHRNMAVSERDWPAERDAAVALLKEPGYQKVLGDRPLVFALDVPRERFAEFRRAAQALNPYCVYMGWDPGKDFAERSKEGFDAVSAYAYGSDAATYAALVRAVEENYWGKAAAARVPFVPLVTTGWDKRPRQEHPVSWERGDAYLKQRVFPGRATPTEIAEHLKRALGFDAAQPEVCPARTVLLYAWNEHDEGGWIEPTWRADGKADTDRLDAIARVLKGD